MAFCWFGMFVTMVGSSQIAPVLPLYLKELGVVNEAAIEQLTGFAFGVTFIVSAIFSPIWGLAADKYGRKPMLLRASLGMSIVICTIGFAQQAWQVVALRALQGAITGYGAACTTLIAVQVDREHAGFALGTLATAGMSGNLIGPTIGGFVEVNFGVRPVFFVTSGLILIAFITTVFFIKENFVRTEHKALPMKEVWKMIPDPGLTLSLFLTFFVLNLALNSIEPIVTIYVGQLMNGVGQVALWAGLAFSMSGFASVIAAPKLGRISDKIGAYRVILIMLFAGAIVYIPMAFVTAVWQLMALRFLFGIANAGLAPSINATVKRITPDAITGRVFGLMQSCMFLGTFFGSTVGGQVAAVMGLKNVFYVTSALLFLNAIWVYNRVYKKIKKAEESDRVDVAAD